MLLGLHILPTPESSTVDFYCRFLKFLRWSSGSIVLRPVFIGFFVVQWVSDIRV